MSIIFLLYIGIVIAFFLIGILFGYLISSTKESKKKKTIPLSEAVKNMPEENQYPGQEANKNKTELQDSLYSNTQRYGYYNYKNYGNSFYDPYGRNRPGSR